MKKVIFFSVFAFLYLACKKEPVPTLKTDPPSIVKIKSDSIYIGRSGGTVAIDLDGDNIDDVKVLSYWYSSGMCFVTQRSMDSVWTLRKEVKVFYQNKPFVYTQDTSKIDSVYHVVGAVNNGGKNVHWKRNKDVVLKMDSLQLYQPLPVGTFSDGGFLINSSEYNYTSCKPYVYTNGKTYHVSTKTSYTNGTEKWLIFEINNHLYAIKLEVKMPYTIIKSRYKIK